VPLTPADQLSGHPAALSTVPPTTIEALSSRILVVFLFSIFSRVFEVKLTGLHIPGLEYRSLLLFLLLTGAFVKAYQDPIGKCILGFTAFFVLAIPFSVWPGGSVQEFMNGWLFSFIVFAAAAALVPDFNQYRKAAKASALAFFVLSVICETMGTTQDGRLFLDTGRYSNPNEIAEAMLLGMPFVWACYSQGRSMVGKIFGAVSLLLMLYVISRTGSRGAMIALAVIVTCMFLRSSLVGKIKVAIGVGLLLLIAALTLSGDLKARYQTFFSEDTEENADQPVNAVMLDSAVSSADQREQMFKESLILTLQHPLLGVGPGMFEVAENDMARAQGKRKGAWIGTHNTFTQVSSECGIPAFGFYVAVVALSFRKTYRLYLRTKDSPGFKDISTQALGLNYSLMAYIVTGFFIHTAYTALLPILAGLAVSLARTAEPVLAAGGGGGSHDFRQQSGLRVAEPWRAL
jgi:O-antigen ligase